MDKREEGQDEAKVNKVSGLNVLFHGPDLGMCFTIWNTYFWNCKIECVLKLRYLLKSHPTNSQVIIHAYILMDSTNQIFIFLGEYGWYLQMSIIYSSTPKPLMEPKAQSYKYRTPLLGGLLFHLLPRHLRR